MPYISRTTIERIDESADLVSVISNYVELKKEGANFKGLSPFSEERTPSFVVSPAKGIWKDFSTGKGGNSAISFVMAKTRCSFPEAVETIANRLGLPIDYEDSKAAQAYIEKEQKKEELTPVLLSAIKTYRERFENLPKDHPAKQEVLEKRKYTYDDVVDYRIGYAPGKDFLYKKCKEAGVVKQAEALGLIKNGYDRYQDRVIYPIIDQRGATPAFVGLAGRTVSKDKKQAKWINSSQSDLYDKSQVWYGMNVAREAIAKERTVWVVEGYNDVIAWHKNGLENTVSPCGTAISNPQINRLKKIADKVIICLDPDPAGKKSALKHIPGFLKLGFRVETLTLPDGLDPDDFSRSDYLGEHHNLATVLNEIYIPEDGFKFLLSEKLNGNKLDKATGARELCRVIANIPDSAIREIYKDWLAKESEVKPTTIKGWIKDYAPTPQAERVTTLTNDGTYILPPKVKIPLKEILPTITKYQMFMAENQIWMMNNDGPPYNFYSVSNFSVDIIQHMRDEKFPSKLIRLKNIHGHETIFDTPSENINTPLAFDNAITAHGNFMWKGGRNEHQRLRAYLFDRMGTGRRIDVLGWQPEGFWCWNNVVSFPDGKQVDIKSNGVFEHEEVSYYVPSANDVYRNNHYKFESQKKVRVMNAPVTFTTYAEQLIKVHRGHGMTAILFAIASAFQDFVCNELGNFPMVFLYGPASSGKDQMVECMQSFFGKPQTGLNLEGGASTLKAQVRELSQFGNMISHLSEYKPGDSKLDGVLKGFWDRRGYKRATFDSTVNTESLPVLSSVVITGNYTPEAEALITRLIWEEMDKTQFDDQEIANYDKLGDMTNAGVSSFANDLIKHRSLVEQHFQKKFRALKATLSERWPEAKSRMVSNVSVLVAFYQLFQNVLEFPFSFTDVVDHFDKGIDAQSRKLSSAGIVTRWWDCYLASMRGVQSDQLRIHRDLRFDDPILSFNFTNSFNKIQRQWWSQYHEAPPGKSVMKDALMKDGSFVGEKAGIRMSQGRDGINTSAVQINTKNLDIREELMHAIEFQLNEGSLFGSAPATPNLDTNNGEDPKLPF